MPAAAGGGAAGPRQLVPLPWLRGHPWTLQLALAEQLVNEGSTTLNIHNKHRGLDSSDVLPNSDKPAEWVLDKLDLAGGLVAVARGPVCVCVCPVCVCPVCACVVCGARVCVCARARVCVWGGSAAHPLSAPSSHPQPILTHTS